MCKSDNADIWESAHAAWEREKCACPSFDPAWCVELRYGRRDIDAFEVGEDEPCDCVCHDHFHYAQDTEENYGG